MQFQRKLMNQPLENGRKLSFGPDFGLFWPKFGSQNFFCGFYLYYMLYIVVSYHCIQFQGKLMNKTGENGKKPSFWPDFDPFGPNWGGNSPPPPPPKNLPPSVTISHGQLSSCRISETTTDPILKKLSERQADRRTEGQTDGQTEESDFIGCCLANVERPKKYNLRKITVLVDKLSNQNLLS